MAQNKFVNEFLINKHFEVNDAFPNYTYMRKGGGGISSYAVSLKRAESFPGFTTVK
jgi:hypothetical protein